MLIDCKLDLISFTESKLNPDRDKDGMYTIEGYNFLRTDRIYNQGGGIISYVRSDINYEQVDCLIPLYDNSEIQVLKITLHNCKPMLIAVLYSHPATPTAKLVYFFRELNTFLLSFDIEYYILGDLNLDLIKYDANSYSLFNVSKEFRLWQHIIGPTFKGSSLLDHIYSSSKNNVKFSGHFPYTSSDHDFTFIVRKLSKPKFQPKFINYRCYKNCLQRIREKTV